MAKGTHVWKIAFRPVNRTLATIEKNAEEPNLRLQLRNYDTGESQGFIEPPGLQIGVSMAFSPDGKLLAFPAKDKGVALWDMENSEIKTIISPES
jgi:WD40 repeat protein